MPPSKKRRSVTSHNTAADYEGGVAYWSSQPASVDGVLGGFGTLDHIDALSSRMFLLTVAPHLSRISGPGKKASASHDDSAPQAKRIRALDVGSGIGRVTASVLLPLVDSVDVAEPAPHFIREALRAAQAGEWKSLKDARGDCQPKYVQFYERGLQDFHPDDFSKNEAGKIGKVGQVERTEAIEDESRPGYDILWCQWCLGHLSDAQLIEWLKACKRAKRDDKSVIVVKENVTSKGDREYDDEDRSWTRSVKVWKQLFVKADLQLFREEKQNGFPTDLFAVWMFAVR